MGTMIAFLPLNGYADSSEEIRVKRALGIKRGMVRVNTL